MLTGSRSFEAKVRHGFDAGFVDNVDVDLGGYTCVRTSYVVSIQAMAKVFQILRIGIVEWR